MITSRKNSIHHFLEKLVVMPSGCIEWSGKKNYKGYGCFSLQQPQPTSVAHRASWMFFRSRREPLIEGLVLDHLCRNRACVNPYHLEQVTQLQNMLRGSNSIKTHCPHGHAYDEKNTARWNPKNRVCRICHNERTKNYWRNKRALAKAVAA